MDSPPDKHETMLKTLEQGSVFVHLDPRRQGVRVPVDLSRRPTLVLQIGLNFPIPIRDLEIDAEGFRCTLSFNRVPCFCVVPWSAVFAMTDETQQVMVWSDDLPDEAGGPPSSVPAPEPVRSRKPREKSAASARKGASGPSPLARAAVTSSPAGRGTASASRSPAAESARPSDASSATTNGPSSTDATPRRTRSGREVPPWLRVVK
jgi:hypothetical protein